MRPVVTCHRAQCRRTSGHHVAASAADRAGVSVTGDLASHDSGPGVRRVVHPTCGSNLFRDRAASAKLSIFAGALDQPTGLRLVEHIHVNAKGDYYRIADGLPRAPGDGPEIEEAHWT